MCYLISLRVIDYLLHPLLLMKDFLFWQDLDKHIHIWHGSKHHHFRQKLGQPLFDDDDSQHKPSFEMASHPQGTVVAPMAGLVVKVLAKDGMRVEEGQPILVLEAMKMEVCGSASFTCYISPLCSPVWKN